MKAILIKLSFIEYHIHQLLTLSVISDGADKCEMSHLSSFKKDFKGSN